MADWLTNKGAGPWEFAKQPIKVANAVWPFSKQGNKPTYNEGHEIATSDNPVWSVEPKNTQTPITVTHNPCGYWTNEPVSGGSADPEPVYEAGITYAGGSDLYGSLGFPDAGSTTEIRRVTYETIFAVMQFRTQNSIAITSEGVLCGAGNNHGSALGDMNYGQIDSSGFYIIHAALFTACSCGSNYSIAVDTSGNVWVVGYNFDYQLGLGDKIKRKAWEIVSGVNFVKVSTSGDESYGIDSDGVLWGAGNNVIGRDQKSSIVFTQAATDIASMAENCRLFILTDGTMYGYGLNPYGSLGFTASWSWYDNLTQESRGYTWTKVSSSGYPNSIAIKSDGTLWGTGQNANGELGLGDTTQREEFTCISEDQWLDITTGYWGIAAIKADYSLWCSGKTPFGVDTTTLTKVDNGPWYNLSLGGWTYLGNEFKAMLLTFAHNIYE